MHLLDNYNNLLGDDFKKTLQKDCKLRIAAACFSMYAFECLKGELKKIDTLEFIFTSKKIKNIYNLINNGDEYSEYK